MTYQTNIYPENMPFNPAPSTIMHIDLNSCFATVEQQANPLLRGKPIAVAAYTTPNGCILAPSTEAKRSSITVGMRVREGKKLCPHLIILPPDPWKYRFVNRRLLSLLQNYSTKVCVKSIDEMVVDFADTPSFIHGMWTLGRQIKTRIRREIGDWLTVSIGIAPNRFLAKTASGLHKPDGLDEINKDNFKEIYTKLRVENLCGIKTNNMARLNHFGIYTVNEMYNASAIRLMGAFHSIMGYYWYLRLRGYEADGVEFTRRSFGHSYALYKATSDKTALARLLCKLVEKMGRRMRSRGYAARGIHIFCQYSDYSFWQKRETVKKILHASRDLYREALRVLLESPIGKPVRVLSVSCFHLEKNAPDQLSLLDVERKKRSLTSALDRISERFGNFTVFPAVMMGTEGQIIDRIAFGSIREIEEFLFAEEVKREPTDYFTSSVYSSVQ